MKNVILIIIVFCCIVRGGFSQIDPIGSGRAISFDGANDYLNLNNIYDDLTFPFTISSWVYLSPSAVGINPIFISQDGAPIYNGFWFAITPTHLFIEYGDGLGEDNPAFRRGKTAPVSNLVGRWIHVCAVVQGMNSIELFVNGVNVGGAYSGNSNLPMASNYPADVAKVGYFFTNGNIYLYKGSIDEIVIWNTSLSQAEIRAHMCKKLSGNEPGLIGYWTFDEISGNTVFDKSPNGFNGQLINTPTRVYSGAPIGDESVFSYQSNWSGIELSMVEGTEEVKVRNILGNPEGVHIYTVRDLPSQTVGLDLALVSDPYFGVFVAATDVGNTFDVSYSSSSIESCGIFVRGDNSVANWSTETSPMSAVIDRQEIIKGSEMANFEINLGDDEIICPFLPKTLSPINDPTGYEFTWQDGSKLPTFLATNYGKYWVIVEKDCLIGKDTIEFSQGGVGVLEIDLGEDEIVCPLEPRILSPLSNPTGFDFTWHDGSKQSTYQVTDYGKFWVTVESECSIGSDTLEISKPQLDSVFIPNVFTPNNGDEFNQYFEIDQRILGSYLEVYNRWGKQVYQSTNYQNDWDGADLPVGVYYFRVYGPCLEEKKGYVSIVR